MMGFIHLLEDIVRYTAEIGIHLVELAGILVLMITAAKGVIGYFKKDPHIRLKLAQGIALALEFKLGGEVLRTVIARDWKELAVLGAVIALRAALTVLLHWEIKTEEQYVEGSIHEIRRK
ncbi:MAG: DUF1622 domain-containing protein [Clostridiales bacterium]|nr:DUF1622 domain-containing protein [Clostridiales bacterium]